MLFLASPCVVHANGQSLAGAVTADHGDGTFSAVVFGDPPTHYGPAVPPAFYGTNDPTPLPTTDGGDGYFITEPGV